MNNLFQSRSKLKATSTKKTINDEIFKNFTTLLKGINSNEDLHEIHEKMHGHGHRHDHDHGQPHAPNNHQEIDSASLPSTSALLAPRKKKVYCYTEKVNHCQHCSKAFRRLSDLRRHMRRKHPELLAQQKGVAVCEYCWTPMAQNRITMHQTKYCSMRPAAQKAEL